MNPLDQPLIDRIVSHLRDCGPATKEDLSTPLSVSDQRLGRLLQAAKADGLIEYSKVGEDRRCYWRLVERPPVRKVGIEEARELIEGPLHYHVKSKVEIAHEQGFDDGQQHAFQIVADLIRQKAEFMPHRKSAKIAHKWADEIESGAWAEEASDE